MLPSRSIGNLFSALTEVEKDPQGLRQIATEVIISPAGEGETGGTAGIPADLPDKLLFRLENRKLDVAGIISLGEDPGRPAPPWPGASVVHETAWADCKPGQGLRLRLRLAPALAGIPWEYTSSQEAGRRTPPASWP